MSDPSFFAHPTAVIDEGCEIGEGCKIWHFCHVSPGVVLGQNTSLGQNCFIAPGVKIGDGVKIQNNVSLYSGVEIGDGVFIGPSAVFTNVSNPRSAIDRRGSFQKTSVKKGATIGANATVVCGIEIGEFAFIGAGAVVTRNVLPYSLVTGNPARHRGWMSEAGQKLVFDEKGAAACPKTGDKYQIEKGVVTKSKPIDPKKRIQIFSSFEEQELAEIDENLAKPVAVRFAEAVDLIRRIYPPVPPGAPRKLTFTE